MKRKKQNSDFALYCCELIEQTQVVGRCQLKFMMGGWAISYQGYNFAFVVDLGDGEQLWLKTDKNTEKEFLEQGSSKFTYTSTHKGQKVQRSLNYYSAPLEALENHQELRRYVQLAVKTAMNDT